MKAFPRGDKIVLQKNEEYVEVEKLIGMIAKDLEKVRSICEDRNAEEFPEETVRRIVQNIEDLKTKGTETHINEEFLKYVMENGSVTEYFSDAMQKSRNEQRLLLKKKEYLKNFADRLEDIL